MTQLRTSVNVSLIILGKTVSPGTVLADDVVEQFKAKNRPMFDAHIAAGNILPIESSEEINPQADRPSIPVDSEGYIAPLQVTDTKGDEVLDKKLAHEAELARAQADDPDMSAGAPESATMQVAGSGEESTEEEQAEIDDLFAADNDGDDV